MKTVVKILTAALSWVSEYFWGVVGWLMLFMAAAFMGGVDMDKLSLAVGGTIAASCLVVTGLAFSVFNEQQTKKRAKRKGNSDKAQKQNIYLHTSTNQRGSQEYWENYFRAEVSGK